ncbi:MAG TPA: hypothetical protein VFA45_03790, partial [Actinomycetes bacterium]|nr:hypothetical protein [Actinomycetes bacterium]
MRTESDPRGEREAEVGRSRRRRAFAAASLSSLLPGAGQLYLGRWRRAAASLLLAALCLAGAAVAWQRRAGLASLLLRPSWLVALLVADAVLLAFRLWSVVDAYRFGAGGASTAPA